MIPPTCGMTYLMSRIALRHAAGDQVQDDGAVLERGADRHREPVIVDHGRADAVLDRVIVQHRPAPVHLLVEWLELRLRGGAVEAGARHRHAEHAELVQPALHLAQGGVDVRQGQRHHGREPARELRGQLGIAVVDEARRRDGIRFLVGIRRARGRREHLHSHLGVIHLLQARRDARGIVVPHRTCRARPRRLGQAAPADAQEHVVVGLRKVVGVDIDDHRKLPGETHAAP